MGYSYDGGNSWQPGPFLPFVPIYYFNFYQNEDTRRLVSRTPAGDTLVMSEDLGFTWQTIPYPGNFQYIKQIENSVYIGGFDFVAEYSFETGQFTDLQYP